MDFMRFSSNNLDKSRVFASSISVRSRIAVDDASEKRIHAVDLKPSHLLSKKLLLLCSMKGTRLILWPNLETIISFQFQLLFCICKRFLPGTTIRKRKSSKKQSGLRNSSFDYHREELLHRIPRRMFLNGSSEVASFFSQQGKKGTDQDAMIVWEPVQGELQYKL